MSTAREAEGASEAAGDSEPPRVSDVDVRELGEQQLDEAMELLHFAFRRVIEEPDSLLDQRGLGRLHHRLLYVVGKNQGLSVGELVELLGVTKQAVHGPLRDLLEGDLVEVSRARGDRRIKRLHLTPEGRRYERRLARAEHRAFAEAFSEAGEVAVVGWRRVMDALGQQRRLRVAKAPDDDSD